jgi:hypothetical protein
MPEVRLAGDEARRAAHGVAVLVADRPPGEVVRLTDDQGLVAIAEPREQGRMLKPIVGLRG